MSRTFKDRPTKLRWDDHWANWFNAPLWKRKTGPKKKRLKDSVWRWIHQTPGWHVSMFSEVPARAEARAWEHAAVRHSGDYVDLDTPRHPKSKLVYYW